MAEERLIVIDTDAGIDDAITLIMAIRAHKEKHIPWKVLGITCVNGNTSQDNVCTNVTRVVKLAGLEDEIPIFRGCGKPLVHKMPQREFAYHGNDGLGDAFPQIQPKLQEEHAAQALIRLAHENEGKLTLMALGPLTNIALAITMDATFAQSLKELCVMGGNMMGIGNIRAAAEFNFWADPESVHVVLESPFKRPILLVPWETCKLEAKMTLEWRTQVMGKVKSNEAEFVNRIEESILIRNEKIHSGWVTCDALVPAVMLNPKLVKETQSHFSSIELNGLHTRGQLVHDHPGISGQPHNILAVTKVDLGEFQNMLLWGVYGKEEDADFRVINHDLFFPV